MKSEGIIYQAKNAKKKKLGFLCLSFSLIGLLFFLSPFLGAEITQEKTKGFAPLIVQEIKPNLKKTEVKTSLLRPERGVKKEDEPIKSFYLTIEKIGLVRASVIPRVDVNNAKDYKQALSKGLVHAKDTALPDEGRMVYIFGHSTNYPWFVQEVNALFYQIEKVEPGDKVKIEFNGRHYLYHVFDKKIVSAQELDFLKEKADEDILVLQSCYPPGTTWQRLLLFARPSKMGALIY